MNTNEPVARLQGLTKVFDSCTALAQVDLTIQAGRIIGLLGANGAGKSTLLRHLVGLYLPDSGTCTTFGCSCAELGPDQLSRIGYVHQDGELLDWMRAGQLIRYVAAYYPEWNEEVEQAFLRDFEVPLDRRVGALSPGQRQRLAILLAIGFEPDLLILDEPAAGLDPVARAKFLDLLVSMIQDQTRTIIISSHILSDVEKVIDHAVIMKQGRILRDCPFDELLEELCRIHLTSLNGDLPADLPFTDVVEEEIGATEAVLTLRHPGAEALAQAEKDLKCRVDVEPLPLEEVYRIVVSD